MKIKNYYFVIVFFLFSCSQIEHVLKESEKSTLLKNKTTLKVLNSPSPILKEQLVFYFGKNTAPEFHLTVDVDENKTNRFVKKNQVATKIDYEIKIKYKLVNNIRNCIILEAVENSRFSFVPKSSGYNFGSDRSLDELYKGVFKNDLISSQWPNYKNLRKFNKHQNEINDLIELISNIRSSKAELKITPKLYCDVFFPEKSSKLKSLIKRNINLTKQVGRINDVLESPVDHKNSIDILVLKEKISLIFSENIDLISQKQRILQKLLNLEKKIQILNNKLENKAYVKNAPKEIVQNDKKLVKELTVEEGKLRSIVSSIN